MANVRGVGHSRGKGDRSQSVPLLVRGVTPRLDFRAEASVTSSAPHPTFLLSHTLTTHPVSEEASQHP